MKITIVIITLAALLIGGSVHGQEFKLAKSSGRLEIYVGRVSVEGYSGNEIVFSKKDRDHRDDERANGLRPVNGMGMIDNTGLGVNVTDKGGVIEVRQLKKTNSPEIKIMVPKGIVIYYSFETEYGGDAKFRNIESEIEVSVNYNNITLENVTGPATIKTVYGHVEADFGSVIKDPISIVSVYGFADVTIPLATKADLKLSTSYGEILVAPEFKIEIDKQHDMQVFSDKITGKINGGGLKIDINSNYGKVYLRKK